MKGKGMERRVQVFYFVQLDFCARDSAVEVFFLICFVLKYIKIIFFYFFKFNFNIIILKLS